MSIVKSGVLITKRGFIVNLIFFFNFFTLYYVFSIYVLKYLTFPLADNLIIRAYFNVIVAITILMISFFIRRFNKLRVIYTCSIAISIVTAILLFASNDGLILAIISVFGIFFGIGQLTFFTYFWNLTVAEERGRIAGLIGFVTLPLYSLIDPGIAGALDFPSTVVLSIILSLGMLIVVMLKPAKAMLTAKKNERGGNYYEKRVVLLYSIPWVIFSLINATLAKNISLSTFQQVSPSFYVFLIVLQAITAIFGTLIGGIIADFFGRRMPLAFSLTVYGISSALAGIADNYTLLYFVYFANGLSWGILLVMYTFVIWGDLANKENCAKMYSIGLIPFYLATSVGLLFTSQISEVPLVVSSLASCLLIFLSNIPIVLAPELLSPDLRERIKLKMHINTVKKIKRSQNQG